MFHPVMRTDVYCTVQTLMFEKRFDCYLTGCPGLRSGFPVNYNCIHITVKCCFSSINSKRQYPDFCSEKRRSWCWTRFVDSVLCNSSVCAVYFQWETWVSQWRWCSYWHWLDFQMKHLYYLLTTEHAESFNSTSLLPHFVILQFFSTIY